MVDLFDNTYENMRRICYGEDNATFIPVCEKCGRFVKADKTVRFGSEGPPETPNATCKKCGRTSMLFEGYI